MNLGCRSTKTDSITRDTDVVYKRIGQKVLSILPDKTRFGLSTRHPKLSCPLPHVVYSINGLNCAETASFNLVVTLSVPLPGAY